MSINCKVILRWTATPEQLRALGTAFWRWYAHAAESSGVYQYLDNQALADLIDGRLPVSVKDYPTSRPNGVPFWVRDEKTTDRETTIARLRREIPNHAVEDIVVEGKSWNQPIDGLTRQFADN